MKKPIQIENILLIKRFFVKTSFNHSCHLRNLYNFSFLSNNFKRKQVNLTWKRKINIGNISRKVKSFIHVQFSIKKSQYLTEKINIKQKFFKITPLEEYSVEPESADSRPLGLIGFHTSIIFSDTYQDQHEGNNIEYIMLSFKLMKQ